ncbi:MAG: hypothetical protein JOY84_05050 [Curvibacter sp.]|nr:hypothetical protein [Curvibacter sp.]
MSTTAMATPSRFKCPACGFSVFNRRVEVCESCRAPLPAEMRFSEGELAWLAEEEARVGKIRQELARQAEQLEAEKQRRRGEGG